MYTYYDPNQAKMEAAARRDAAMQRLMTIMDSRQQAADLERVKMEQEMARQVEAQKQGMWDNMGSAFGSAAQGAMVGTAFNPGIGTAIGAGAGLLLGGIAEAKSRKDFQKAEGHGGSYGWGDALKDTFVRTPNMGEVGTIAGAGASVGASMAARNAAAQQANSDWAAQGNALADFERFHGLIDPRTKGMVSTNQVTAGTYSPNSLAGAYQAPTAPAAAPAYSPSGTYMGEKKNGQFNYVNPYYSANES